MSLDVKIHKAQTNILRELLFRPEAGFSALQKPTGLSSDHFNFHISRLVELCLVEKVSRGKYRLTTRGKEYANRLDTDNNTIERQPKTAVILGLTRNNSSQTQYLFQQRLKNPYFGFWGLPSGKIRWGETIIEAAARECLEETGLSANFTVASVYHEHAREAESGIIVEDKIFFVIQGLNPTGKLKTDFEGGHNEWRSLDDVLKEPKKYITLAKEVKLLTTKSWLHEQTVNYSKREF
ncbi:MAG: NUDIX hydrolase [Candidatus Saccharimonadales bacterium]